MNTPQNDALLRAVLEPGVEQELDDYLGAADGRLTRALQLVENDIENSKLNRLVAETATLTKVASALRAMQTEVTPK